MPLDDLRRDLEAEPLTGVDALRADLLGPTISTPRDDEALSIPTLGEAVQQIPGQMSTGLRAARDWMQPAANNLVNFAGDVARDFAQPWTAVERATSGPRSLFSGPSEETRATPASPVGRVAAEIVNQVPGNLTEALGAAGTIALGPYGILSRILGGAGGSALGQAIEGGDATAIGKAAVLGGGANLVGEGVAGGLSLAAKSVPGAVSRIRHQDATRLLEAAPEISAGLGRVSLEGRTASEALQDLARKGKTGLNDAKEEAIQRIESVLQTPGATRPEGMPQAQGPVGPVTDPGAIQGRRLQEINEPWAAAPEAEAWRPRDLVGAGGVLLDIPSIGRPVSLRDANAELTAIGEGLRHTQILDPTMRQREAGRAYATLSEEIRQALDAQSPGLGAAFNQAQQAYAAGLDYLKKIASPNNWTPGSSGIEFDARAMQRGQAKAPLGAERTEQRMGEEGSATFIDALTRGEGLGRVDKIPAGGGGFSDALMQWLRGGNSGSMGLPQALIRSVAPNVGAQYIGRKPYTIDPGVKALMDIIGQRAMESALGGTPIKIGPVP